MSYLANTDFYSSNKETISTDYCNHFIDLYYIYIAGIIHIGSQSKFVPYIVEVNKLGETVGGGEIRAGTILDQRIIRAKVASFIKTLRTVSVDPTNPFELGKKINREVEIVSLLEMTSNTYQLDWKEKTFDKSGVLLYIKGYRALVTVYLIPTAVESIEDLTKNPLGIYIKYYSIYFSCYRS